MDCLCCLHDVTLHCYAMMLWLWVLLDLVAEVIMGAPKYPYTWIPSILR
jgi:hypothetical protein